MLETAFRQTMRVFWGLGDAEGMILSIVLIVPFDRYRNDLFENIYKQLMVELA